MNHTALGHFFDAIIISSEVGESTELEARSGSEIFPNGARDQILHHLVEIACNLPNSSSSSRSWMEMVIVDAALRNRDRFIIYLPVLASHYERTLSAAKSLSFVTER